MSRAFLIVFLIGALILLGLFVVLGEDIIIHDGSALVLQLGGPIEEQRPGGALGELTGPPVLLTHLVLNAIQHAKGDARIAGLVVKITPLESGWAKADEIREQILDFRKGGKPAICFLEADIVTNREYFLATACDKVWMIPSASLGAAGMMAQATFYKGSLEKLGIEPNLFGIAEYKTYRNQFTEKQFTLAHREAAESLLRSVYDHYVARVAEARNIDPAAFDSLLHNGPYLAKEAVAKKLVDKLAYWDEVQRYFEENYSGWKPVTLKRYVKEVPNDGFENIAVIRATGAIVMGRSAFDSWQGFLMGADSVVADIRRARQDDSVKAIVLRVDSGGGSAAASELIRREVKLAREVKPVVVSMADAAASGGYWIAMSANKIVAGPTTVTGSIGVVFGKMNIAGLYKLLGLSTDHVATHDNATMLWEQQNFTPAQREMVMKFMQDTYSEFKQGVAEGRSLKLDEVETIARGRVWSGAQAKDRKLVDEFGGLHKAIDVARELAKVDPARKLRIQYFPEEKSLWQELAERAQPNGLHLHAALSPLRRLTRLREWVEVRLPFELEIR
jgi:protease-4